MLRTHRNNLLGEKTLAKYNSYLLAKYRARKKEHKTFGGFIEWIRSRFAREIQLRNWLKIKGGRIADYPKLLKEYSKKNPLPPTEVAAGSDLKLLWDCPQGHEYPAQVKHRVYNNTTCPYCANQSVGPTNNLAKIYPGLAAEYSSRNPLKATEITPGSNRRVWWRCSKGHEWQTTVKSRVDGGHGCNKCRKRIASPEYNLALLYPKLAAEYSSLNPKPASEMLPKSRTVCWWKCIKKGHEWQTSIRNRTILGNNCPYCGGRYATPGNNLAVTHPHLAAEYSPKNPLPITSVLAQTNKMLWWICSKNKKHKWQADGNSRVRGGSCPKCPSKTSLAVLYPTLAREYSRRNRMPATKVSPKSPIWAWWKCNKKHEWQEMVKSRVQYGMPCPVCAAKGTQS